MARRGEVFRGMTRDPPGFGLGLCAAGVPVDRIGRTISGSDECQSDIYGDTGRFPNQLPIFQAFPIVVQKLWFLGATIP